MEQSIGFTPENLATLEAAMAQGVLRVRYGDKEVQYQTLKEMRELRQIMLEELGLVPRFRRSYPSHSKGL